MSPVAKALASALLALSLPSCATFREMTTTSSDLEDYRSRLGVTFDNPASTVPGSAQRDRPAE